MADDELRIRQLAYRIWESEGRPDGQEQRHWEMARKIVAAEHESGREAHPDVEIEPDATDPDLPVRDDELGVEQDDMGLGSSTDPEADVLADETPDRNLGRKREGGTATQSDAASAETPLPEESATVKRARKPRRTEDTVSQPNAGDTSSPGRSATTRSRAGAAKATGTKSAKASTASKAKAGGKAAGTSTRSRPAAGTKSEKSEKGEKKTKTSDTARKTKK